MTTIAYRAGVIAADSQIVEGPVRSGRACKIVRMPNGGLVGAAGDLIQCAAFLAAMRASSKLTPQILRASPEVHAIIVMPDGSVGYYVGGEHGGISPVEAEFVAEGSGHVAALAAMHAGASAIEAVEIAAKVDVNTALPVMTLKLEKRRCK